MSNKTRNIFDNNLSFHRDTDSYNLSTTPVALATCQVPQQILHNRCPSYLTDLVEFNMADSQRHQLGSSLTRADVVKRTRTHFGKRAFSVCGPHTWNSLPPAVRNILSSVQTSSWVTSVLSCFYWLTFILFSVPKHITTIDYCNAQSALFVWLGTITLLSFCHLSFRKRSSMNCFRNNGCQGEALSTTFDLTKPHFRLTWGTDGAIEWCVLVPGGTGCTCLSDVAVNCWLK